LGLWTYWGTTAHSGTVLAPRTCWGTTAHSGTVLGPWTCWGTTISNHRQARQGRFCSKVCRTSACLGVSTQNIKRKMKGRVDNQHLLMWLENVILGPSPTTKTRFCSYNRTQSRVVIGLLTGQNTLRRHLHLVALTNGPVCRRCGAEEETSALDLCTVRHGFTQTYTSGLLFLGLKILRV
jgi:hypothetical protein